MKVIVKHNQTKLNLSVGCLIDDKYNAFISEGELYIVIKGYYIWRPSDNKIWYTDHTYPQKYFVIDRFCDIKIEEIGL